MALIQNATMLIVIQLDIDCKRHFKAKFLAILGQKHLTKTFSLYVCNILSLFLKLWLHLTVSPSSDSRFLDLVSRAKKLQNGI